MGRRSIPQKRAPGVVPNCADRGLVPRGPSHGRMAQHHLLRTQAAADLRGTCIAGLMSAPTSFRRSIARPACRPPLLGEVWVLGKDRVGKRRGPRPIVSFRCYLIDEAAVMLLQISMIHCWTVSLFLSCTSLASSAATHETEETAVIIRAHRIRDMALPPCWRKQHTAGMDGMREDESWLQAYVCIGCRPGSRWRRGSSPLSGDPGGSWLAPGECEQNYCLFYRFCDDSHCFCLAMALLVLYRGGRDRRLSSTLCQLSPARGPEFVANRFPL